MNQEAMMELVVSSQAGDIQALEQLMLYAHTPVLYLCRKLLHDEQTAQEQTREVLQIIRQKLEALENPAEFENWLCRITSARCMQVLRQLRNAGALAEPEHSRLSISGKTLNEEETADAIEKMVDMLPEETRICIYLCCCGSMNSRAVSQVTGYSVDAVRANLNRGYAVLQKMLEKYEQRGTQFSGVGSVAEILRVAMYRVEEDDSAMVMVYGILGKKLPAPPQPGRWIVWVLLAVVGILLAADLVLGGMLLLNRKNSVSEEFVLPAIQITSIAAETTEETTPETAVQTADTTQPEN